MTDEINKLANDPNFAVQFAVGDPFPELKAQEKGRGIQINRVYFDQAKRYVLKSAHMSRDDVRVLDVDTGRVVMVGHYPGKNPYSFADPLGLTNQDKRYQTPMLGGEWQSLYSVTGTSPFPSMRIRPKWLSRHGRQLIYLGDKEVMNIGKVGKFKTMSLRDQFKVTDTDETYHYTCIADMSGRTVAMYNPDDELVAQLSKTTKALILSAAFGKGSESTIDIAPGVDCSTILAIVYGLRQVGEHCKSNILTLHRYHCGNPSFDGIPNSLICICVMCILIARLQSWRMRLTIT